VTVPTLTVVVNGEVRALDGPVSVDGLVAALGVERRGLAVAVNGEVVPRSTWAGHDVVDGDQVEILTVAQGG
jgi:sulfur carrier protein